MIKNIVFDMGNVMLRFDRDYFLDAVGVKGEDRKLLLNNVYVSLEWARMDRGSMTEAEAAASMCQRLPERLHEKVHRLVDQWDRPILPVEGTAELIAELKALGYQLYLLSNASYRQHEYWPRIPGSEYFDGALVSADEKLVKPQPEIYRLLFSRFSLRPEECFFIDDSPQNVEGAFYCGMPGAVFNDGVPALRKALRAAGVPVKE